MKTLSTELLNTKIDSVEEERIINDIHAYFQDITKISGYDSEINRLASVQTANGKALGLNYAAQCLLDYKRTVQFLRGFVTAIKDKQEKYIGETIYVFYAGCGPYAPFITMIAPLFSPEEIQFSLLEINKDSLESAKKLIVELNLAKYVEEYYLADATTFQIPSPEKIHILFSETLDALLYRECYVPILYNLLPQLPKDVVIIPENVSVKLNFKTGNEEIFAKEIFNTRKELEKNIEQKKKIENFPPVIVSLTDAAQYDRILLDTEVQIYKNYQLKRNESSLTLALEMEIEKPIQHKQVKFTYHLKPEVELKFALEK